MGLSLFSCLSSIGLNSLMEGVVANHPDRSLDKITRDTDANQLVKFGLKAFPRAGFIVNMFVY